MNNIIDSSILIVYEIIIAYMQKNFMNKLWKKYIYIKY